MHATPGLPISFPSTGAACHSDKVEVSYVLSAMGVPLDYAMGTVRFSTGRYTTQGMTRPIHECRAFATTATTAEEIEKAVFIVVAAVKRLQPMPGGADASCVLPAQSENVKLTAFTHGLGCACKLRPQVNPSYHAYCNRSPIGQQALEQVLKKLPLPVDSNILVGIETGDDAAVYKGSHLFFFLFFFFFFSFLFSVFLSPCKFILRCSFR